MARRLMTIVVAGALATGTYGSAQAQVDHSLAERDTQSFAPDGLEAFTFDLIIDTGVRDWTSTWGRARVLDDASELAFYQHPLGGLTTPDPNYFPEHPGLVWDTFWTIPRNFPNTDEAWAFPVVDGDTVVTPKQVDGIWFDTVSDYNSPWVIARYTLVQPAEYPDLTLEPIGSPVGVIFGTSTTDHPSNLYDYSFNIYAVPEPASASVLLATALAFLRRQTGRGSG
jgi:hypothetical protein